MFNIGVLTKYTKNNYFGSAIKHLFNRIQKYNSRMFIVDKLNDDIIKSEDILSEISDIKIVNSVGFGIFDGIIVLPFGSDELYSEVIKESGIPSSYINDIYIGKNICNFTIDNKNSMYNMTKHLIEHGHKKIAMVTVEQTNIDFIERVEGYRECMREYNLAENIFTAKKAMYLYGVDATYEIMKANKNFTAIIASNDCLAIGIIDKLHEYSIKVPDDIAVVGYDNSENSEKYEIPLTTVEQDLELICNKAVDSIIDRIENSYEKSETYLIRGKQIYRKSCGCEFNYNRGKAKLDNRISEVNKAINEFENIISDSYEILKNTSNLKDCNESDTIMLLSKLNYRRCFGIWKDNQKKILKIDKIFSDKEEYENFNMECEVENFPPEELYMSGDTANKEVVWIQPFRTLTKEWGFISYIKPQDTGVTLLSLDLDIYTYTIVANILEQKFINKKLQIRENGYKNLLNNAGQGFMTVNEDMCIDNEYSIKCEEIFGGEIGSQKIEDLLEGNNVNDSRYISALIKDILEETNKKRIKVLISLLPDKLMINEKTIKSEYKIINDESKNKIMIILTDVSSETKMHDKLNTEISRLKLGLNFVRNKKEVIEAIGDYKKFVQEKIKSFVEELKTPKEVLSKIFYCIHTLKGTLGQNGLFNIVSILHDFEEQILKMKNSEEITKKDIVRIIDLRKMESWLDKDLKVIESILGTKYINSKNIVNIEREKIIEIEKKILAFITPRELNTYLPELSEINNKSVKALLSGYTNYVYDKAKTLGKEIKKFEILGKDVKVNVDMYRDFINSMVNVFNNILSHGIETSDERILKGKEKYGNVSCSTDIEEESFSITVTDDGNGINFTDIKDVLVKSNKYKENEVSQMTENNLIEEIFEDGFSTETDVSNIAGRGYGLSAVKYEVERLNGTIFVETEKDKCTKFKFSFPYKDINVMEKDDLIDIVESLKDVTLEYLVNICKFSKDYHLQSYHNTSSKLELDEYNAYLNFKSNISGRIIISFSNEALINLTKEYLLCEVGIDEMEEIMVDVASEVTNNLITKALEKLKGDGEYIKIGSPTVIYDKKNVLLKFKKADIYTHIYNFKDGRIKVHVLISSFFDM